MWIAVGIKTKSIYMISNTKSALFLRLQGKYKSSANVKCKNTYPEPLIVQRRI